MARNVMERSGPEITDPYWLADFINRDNMSVFPAAIDAAQFVDQSGILVKANGGAAIGATSITVDALSGPIPAGTLLIFGAVTSQKFARLTARAETGATTISVNALVTAIADNDEAVYSQSGRVGVPSGTVVGRTLAERTAGTGFGPLAAADEEVGIILFDIYDASQNPDCELLRPKCGATVKENYLPNWANLAGAVQTLIRTNYNTIIGID